MIITMKKDTLIGNIFSYICIVILLIIIMFPLVYIFAGAFNFKTNAELLAHPERIFSHEPTFQNYITAWNSETLNIPRMTWNSTYYTVCCVIASMLFSSMGGYVFARGEFPGKKTWFSVFSALMFINLGSITVYPMFDILKIVGINKSLWGLIVVKCFGIQIVNIYLVRSYIRTIPKEIDEAAEIDGCSFMRTFFNIHVPILKPILATIGILTFKASWNEYLMPAIFTMTNQSQKTLTVGLIALKNSGDAAANWALMLAGSSISLMPVIIAFVFGNRYFMSGLTSGSVKG